MPNDYGVVADPMASLRAQRRVYAIGAAAIGGAHALRAAAQLGAPTPTPALPAATKRFENRIDALAAAKTRIAAALNRLLGEEPPGPAETNGLARRPGLIGEFDVQAHALDELATDLHRQAERLESLV